MLHQSHQPDGNNENYSEQINTFAEYVCSVNRELSRYKQLHKR